MDQIVEPAYLKPVDAEASGGPAPIPPLVAQKRYAAGREALHQGDSFKAVQELEKALRLSPGDSRVLRALGEAWARAGNRVSAANFYRRAYAAAPGDLDSLVMLGRFALEDRRWDEAIATLHAALRHSTSEPAPAAATDEAAEPLIRFFLANALSQAGHAGAAGEMFAGYLDADRGFARSTPYARELAAIDAQRGETLLMAGDLQHRLDRPRQALRFYEAADEASVLNPDALRRRMVYTRLRLGQPGAAEDLAVEAVAEGSADSLSLIPYVVEQGVPAEALARRLMDLYRQRDRSAALALAMADVLHRPAAADLLREHLADRPEDGRVFDRLLQLLVSPDATQAQRAEAVAATAEAMHHRPDQAADFARRLLQAADPPASLLDASPSPPDTADPAEAATRWTLLSMIQQAADRTDDAEASMQEAMRLSPESRLARVELASLRLDRGEVEAARELLEPLHDATDARVVSLRVRALTESGRQGEALALLDEVLRQTPPGSVLMRQKAELLVELERYAEAERVLLDMLNARPTDESIYAALLALYEEDGSLASQGYTRLVRRMIDTIPRARITRLVLTELQLAQRNFAAAEQGLASLEADFPGDADTRRVRMQLYIDRRQSEEVMALVDRHLAEAGDAPDGQLLAMAEAYFRRSGDEASFNALIRKRWTSQPPSLQRASALAQVNHREERWAEARDAAKEAMAHEVPDDEDLRRMLGGLLVDSTFKAADGGPEEAEAAAIEAMDRFPEVGADVALWLNALLIREGHLAQAEAWQERALQRYPEHPQLNNAVGYALANSGRRLDEAAAMIRKAIAAEPDTAAYLDSMGWVYYKQGDFEEALRWLQRGRAADGGSHPVILDHLGDTLYRLDRKQEAVRIWNEAKAIVTVPGYEGFDPEEEGLDDRLTLKIEAVREDRPAAVAELGEPAETQPDPPLEAGRSGDGSEES